MWFTCLPLKKLSVWGSPSSPSSSTSSTLAVSFMSLQCGLFFFGGHTVVGLTYSLFRFIKNWPIDNELRWIKWNPVGRQTSPNTIPTDPKRIFLFISNMLWARRKDLVQSALGFCSVQGVIFSSFVYSHFLDITKRTFFPNEAWKLIVSCQEGSF